MTASAGLWQGRHMARTALLSAALRHVRDAEHLLATGDHQSLAQALHLVGFGPECARKGCVDESLADKALGHEIHGADTLAVEFLLALDPSAGRYAIDLHEQSLPLRTAHWRVESRYMESDHPGLTYEKISDLVIEARAMVDTCICDLWCDGVLRIGGLR